MDAIDELSSGFWASKPRYEVVRLFHLNQPAPAGGGLLIVFAKDHSFLNEPFSAQAGNGVANCKYA